MLLRQGSTRARHVPCDPCCRTNRSRGRARLLCLCWTASESAACARCTCATNAPASGCLARRRRDKRVTVLNPVTRAYVVGDCVGAGALTDPAVEA
eukprot:scaffold3118_cov377-Prasinococcus_capsulatus_cf.AAC.6